MRCPYCNGNNTETATICVACGAPLTGATGPPSVVLPVGTRLQQGHFSVGKVLGQGGFGITYLGADTRLYRPVAIKEFFIDGCLRQGSSVVPSSSITQVNYQNCKARFIEEARTLARFQDPNIVDVYSYFEENNTAYMVMEFLKGKTLSKLVEERGALPEEEALAYIQQVGKALSVVHQANYLHRDISPDNVMIANEGRVVLVDFGAARAFVAGKTQRMTKILRPGYAPLEQYGSQARFGPFTDIYALGGTLYYLLTREVPVDSTDRANGVELPSVRQFNPRVSERVAQAVMQAMAMRVAQRPQSIHEFLNLLFGSQPGSQKALGADELLEMWLSPSDHPSTPSPIDAQSQRGLGAKIRCYSCGRINSVRGDETAFSCRYCGTNINVAARQNELFLGEAVPDVQESEEAPPIHPESLMQCPICNVDVRAKNLMHHLANTHPDCFLDCPICNVEVKAKNLEHHLNKIHSVTADDILGFSDSIDEDDKDEDNIFARVRKVVAEQLGVDPDDITPAASFADDLGADSLDAVELVMALEEEFDVEIPDEAATEIITVQDVIYYLKKNLIS